jgi:hypothetical protein
MKNDLVAWVAFSALGCDQDLFHQNFRRGLLNSSNPAMRQIKKKIKRGYESVADRIKRLTGGKKVVIALGAAKFDTSMPGKEVSFSCLLTCVAFHVVILGIVN